MLNAGCCECVLNDKILYSNQNIPYNGMHKLTHARKNNTT